MLELSNAARECVLAPLEKSVQIATIRRSQDGPVAGVDVELASELDIELASEPDIELHGELHDASRISSSMASSMTRAGYRAPWRAP
jgi:hypothetical protein